MEINLGRLAFDIDFHPSRELVIAGLINEDLHLYSYANSTGAGLQLKALYTLVSMVVFKAQ